MMSIKRAIDIFARVMRPTTRLFHYIGVSVLAILMLFTATDVILRNTTSLLIGLQFGTTMSILGWYELTEYLMIVLVSFTLAYCGMEKGHVAIELIVSRFPQRAQTYVDSIANFISLGFFTVLTWQSALYIMKISRSSTTLLIPAWPFVAVITVGCALLCLVFLLHFLESLSKGMEK